MQTLTRIIDYYSITNKNAIS